MSQCVPNWDVDDGRVPTRLDLHPHQYSTSASYSSAPYVPILGYETAEPTWENGQLSMHGLGLRRVSSKPHLSSSANPKDQWDKPRAAPGTLESIVNLATQKPPPGNAHVSHCDGADLVPWFHRQHHQPFGGVSGGKAAEPDAAAGIMDALVPCTAANEEEQEGELGVHQLAPCSKGVSTCMEGSSTRVDSCSGPATWGQTRVGDDVEGSSTVARVPVTGEWSSEQNVSASVCRSDTFDSRRVPTVDTCQRELSGPSTASFCSQGNTFSSLGRDGTTNTTSSGDDHDSVCHSRPQKRETAGEEDRNKGTSKSSISTKRSRAATVHNQSERKRRDKINQKMKMLQKLVPSSSKTDKASVLDEVIDYVKQLQAQVQMMSRMTMQPMMMMMMPLPMQQQLQMSMMAPMAMGMGMGAMGMNMNMMSMNPMARQNLAALSPVMNPTAAFTPPAASWDVNGTRLPSQAAIVPGDPISTYLACQSQPMTMEAYSRMVSLVQQKHQEQASTLTNNGKFCY